MCTPDQISGTDPGKVDGTITEAQDQCAIALLRNRVDATALLGFLRTHPRRRVEYDAIPGLDRRNCDAPPQAQ